MDGVVLSIKDLHQHFGKTRILHDINLDLEGGTITALLGPSGCGKTTLLSAILGTLHPSAGSVTVFPKSDGQGGVPVSAPGPDRGVVYQRYSLFPQKTALHNVALGLFLRHRWWSKLLGPRQWLQTRRRHLEEAAALLDKLHLGDAKDRYPSQLSGGMQQRVAIAQAIITKPAVLVLDEPFGALDQAVREDMQDMLVALNKESLTAVREGRTPPFTILIVTHEIKEGLYVANRVVGLSRYWDWKDQGFDACPGATIVYDDLAADEAELCVLDRTSRPDFRLFDVQVNEIVSTAFDESIALNPATFRRYTGRGHSHSGVRRTVPGGQPHV